MYQASDAGRLCRPTHTYCNASPPPPPPPNNYNGATQVNTSTAFNTPGIHLSLSLSSLPPCTPIHTHTLVPLLSPYKQCITVDLASVTCRGASLWLRCIVSSVHLISHVSTPYCSRMFHSLKSAVVVTLTYVLVTLSLPYIDLLILLWYSL